MPIEMWLVEMVTSSCLEPTPSGRSMYTFTSLHESSGMETL